jgi:uncharacterized protein YtpQ (UPF0354 family)
MFNLFRISARVEQLEGALAQLKIEFKYYKDEFEKLEIKALESRKIYGKKLKQILDKEENNEPKDIYNGVLLPS